LGYTLLEKPIEQLFPRRRVNAGCLGQHPVEIEQNGVVIARRESDDGSCSGHESFLGEQKNTDLEYRNPKLFLNGNSKRKPVRRSGRSKDGIRLIEESWELPDLLGACFPRVTSSGIIVPCRSVCSRRPSPAREAMHAALPVYRRICILAIAWYTLTPVKQIILGITALLFLSSSSLRSFEPSSTSTNPDARNSLWSSENDYASESAPARGSFKRSQRGKLFLKSLPIAEKEPAHAISPIVRVTQTSFLSHSSKTRIYQQINVYRI
jgi:hypothetical protein